MTGDLFGDASPAEVGTPRLTQWSPVDWHVQPDWQPVLDAFWRSEQGVSLAKFVQSRLDAGAVIYPNHPLWALRLTPLSQVKVVILGQDPYHGPHQAQGLSFSVAPGVKIPPLLAQHLQRAPARPESARPSRWIAGSLGQARRVVAQHMPDCGRQPAR